MLDVILKRFEEPDEVRVFEKGKFELVTVGGMTIGRASYEPGWKWSLHVGAAESPQRRRSLAANDLCRQELSNEEEPSLFLPFFRKE